jgi:hypothetical protein
METNMSASFKLRVRSRLGVGLALLLAACGGAADAPEVATHAASVSTPVTVAAVGARACDLVLDVGNDPITGVRFADGVAGSHFRRAPRLAISFTSQADTELPAAPFTIQAATTLAPRTISLRCVDRRGQPVAGANLAAASITKDQ